MTSKENKIKLLRRPSGPYGIRVAGIEQCCFMGAQKMVGMGRTGRPATNFI
jgi:hypothetical protein